MEKDDYAGPLRFTRAELEEQLGEDEKLPEKTEDFLRWLDCWWPHRCPEQGMPLEGIHRYAGARELIDCMLFRAFGSPPHNLRTNERR